MNITFYIVRLLFYCSYKKNIRHTLALCFPKKNKSELNRIFWSSLQHTEADMRYLKYTDQLIFNIDGLEHLPRSSGAVIGTCHIGNIAAPLFALKKKGFNVICIIGVPEYPFLQNPLGEMLTKIGIPYLVRGEGLFLEILKHVKKGTLVFIDTDISVENCQPVPFLNLNTLLPDTTAALSIIAKAPLFFAYTLSSPTHANIIIKPVKNQSKTLDKRTCIQTLFKQLITTMEYTIKEYPDRWMWLLIATKSLKLNELPRNKLRVIRPSEIKKLSMKTIHKIRLSIYKIISSALFYLFGVFLYIPRRKSIEVHIKRLFPRLTKTETNKLIWNSACDSINNIRNIKKTPDAHIAITGLDFLPKHSGAVLASFHMGNPASSLYGLKNNQFNVETILSLPAFHYMEKLLLQSFSKIGIIHIKRQKGMLFKLINKVNKGTIIHIDCDISESDAKKTKFLKSEFLLPNTASALSVISGAPLFFMYTISDFPEEKIYIQKITLPESKTTLTKRNKIDYLQKEIINNMESLIIKYPERWMWILFCSKTLR